MTRTVIGLRSAVLAVSLLMVLALTGAWPARADDGASTEDDRPKVPIVILDSGITPEDVEKRPYAEYVAECVELLMECGTDRYGEVHRPLLVTILDVRTRACPESPPEKAAPWRGQIRECFWKPRGADLLVDQSTVEVLYLLTQRSGRKKYAQFADTYLAAAMELRDEKEMFWWGWHRFYDVFDDKLSGSHGNYHEIHVNRPRWQRFWRINPTVVRKELELIWKWHVVDKISGEHNRHADGRRGCDFAMSGGEFIYALAFLYKKTGKRQYLEGAKLVADYHWRARNRSTNLTPNRPNAGARRFDGSHCDTSVTGLLCYYLLKSYELVGEQAFRDQAVAYLQAYAKYGYDGRTGKFAGSLRLDGTPEPGPRVLAGYAQYEPRGPIDLWEPYQLGYEYPIYTAQAYAYAHQLTGEATMLETARRWADWIRRNPPSGGCLEKKSWYGRYAELFGRHGTYADMYGRTISLFVHLYALTGEEAYLDDARRFAQEAVSKLYYKGLLRGHPAKPFYSSVDGVGFLLYALLQLDCVLQHGQPLTGKQAIPLNRRGDTIRFDNW